MIDYKQTLLMPSTTLEMKADLKTKEPQWQTWWLNHNIYEKRLLKNKHLPFYTLHDGPPYANGNIHVGHALNKILKDIIVRYKNMHGFQSIYIPGWDTHGLPIENAIAKFDKNYENNNMSPIDKRKLCRNYANEQIEIQKVQFQRLGLLCDFKHIYKTMDEDFILSELSLFKTLITKNLVFQDLKPVYWSWSTKCALAEAEIEYHDTKSPSVYVSFKLIDNSAQLLIWTTTPWTLPANLAIAVNPDINYGYVKVGQDTFIVAETLIEKIANKLHWQNFNITKIVKGTSLNHLKYRHPWIDRISPVILASYVSSEDGTGLVHNAPGFGLDDYYACKNNNIDIYCPIDDDGKYTSDINDEELNGIFYLKANPIIISRLQQANALWFNEEIVHATAHDWRTNKPVIYRATKQWFINIEKISQEICTSLDQDVSAVNAKTIERIKEMIANRKEWCVSRQRVWGVPIPIIYNDDYKPIFDIKLIDHILEIIKNEGVDIWFCKDVEYFIPNWMDQTKTYHKEKDIIDVWFDSGSTYNVMKKYNLPYPADMYLEGSDQFRGWFNSSAINGTIQNGHVPYKFLLQHGFTLDENGFKMSKSKGNVIDPLKVCDEFGADVIRLWVTSSEYGNDMKFGNNILKQTAESYRKIRNTLFRYTLSNLNDFDYVKDFQTKLRLEDYYVLNELKNILYVITKAYDNFNFIEIVKSINNFTNQMSQWYFDIIKDILYCEQMHSLKRKQIQTTLYIILKNLLIVLAPILVHTCEEVYQLLPNNVRLESVALEDWPIIEDILIPSNANISIFNDFFPIKDKIYAELEKARQAGLIKKNSEATVEVHTFDNVSNEQFAKWLNVAKVIYTNSDEIIIKNEILDKCQRCWNYFDNRNMVENNLCLRCAEIVKKY